MASSSSAAVSDEEDAVELLGLVGDLDEATAKMFFNDGDLGGAAMSWPTAEKMRSRPISEEEVRGQCLWYNVTKEYTPRCAGNLSPCQAPPPPEGTSNAAAICVFPAAFEAGLRFPLHDFYVSILQHYDLAPSQLIPNAWSYIASFVRLCKDAGVDPLVSVFCYYFSVCAHTGEYMGWYHFSPSLAVTDDANGRRRCLFTGVLPVKQRWRSKFFFLEPPPETPWPFPSKWGMPRPAAVRRTMSKTAQDAACKLLKYVDAVGASDNSISITSIVVKPEQELPVAPITLLPAAVKVDARAAVAAGAGDSSLRRKRKSLASTTPPTATTHRSFAAASPGSNADENMGIRDDLQAANDKAAEDAVHIAKGQPPEAKDFNSKFLEDFNAKLMDLNAKLEAECLAEVAKLQEKHVAEIAKLEEKRAAEAAEIDKCLAEVVKLQEVDKLRQERLAEAAKLQEEHAAEVAKLQEERAAEVVKLQEDHAAEVAKLQEDHAAEVAKLQEERAKLAEEYEAKIARAKEEELDAKRNLVLALFPAGMDASLMERLKLLKEEPGACADR